MWQAAGPRGAWVGDVRGFGCLWGRVERVLGLVDGLHWCGSLGWGWGVVGEASSRGVAATVVNGRRDAQPCQVGSCCAHAGR